jgi:hypothetical protein
LAIDCPTKATPIAVRSVNDCLRIAAIMPRGMPAESAIASPVRLSSTVAGNLSNTS